MRNPQIRLRNPVGAAVVNQIRVRLISPEEQTRWDQLVSQHHYLKNARLVGERLCYVVEFQGQWLALLGWSAAAYHHPSARPVDRLECQSTACAAPVGG